MRRRLRELWDGLRPLDPVRSIKAKLGLVVAVSVAAASLITWFGVVVLGWWARVTVPAAVLVSLAVTQVVAHGMTSPLRQMTLAARRMAAGQDHGPVDTTSRDEVGELARAFTSMAADLATADRQRRDLLANVAHELRTPVSALRAQLENMADGVREPDAQALGELLDRAERLGDLVDDLLDLARADADAVRLRREDLCLNDLVAAVVADVTAARPGRDVEVRIPPDLVVHADGIRMRQIMSNLVDNAVRHARSRVEVSAARESRGTTGAVVIEVADDGPGIPEHERAAVFERFRRGAVAEAATGGTGLGLAIARWAVALHGGRIGVADSGSGCLIRVELPRAGESLPPAPSRRLQTTAPPLEPPFPPPGGSMTDQPPPGAVPGAVPGAAAESAPGSVPGAAPGSVPDAAPAVAVATVPPPSPYPVPPAADAPWSFFTAPAGPVPVAALVMAVLAGLVVALAVFGAPLGAQYPAAAVLATSAWVWGSRPARARPLPVSTYVLAALAVALSSVAAFSASAATVVPCLLAAFGCALWAALEGRTWISGLLTGPMIAWSAVRTVPWVARRGRNHGGRRIPWALIRGVVLGVLLVWVVGALLVSADAAFSEVVGGALPAIDVGSLPLRVILGASAVWLALALVFAVSSAPRWEALTVTRGRGQLGEWAVPLAAAVALLAAFVVVQVIELVRPGALVGGSVSVVEAARQGFGQLVAVTLIMAGVLAWTGRRCDRSQRRQLVTFMSLGGALLVLVVAVSLSALDRMRRYQEAFGYTVLRIDVAAFEIWLVLTLIAVAVVWAVGRASWIPRLVVVGAAAGLLVLSLAKPEALAAHWNVDRGGEVDLEYLATLSQDVAPAVDRLPEPDRSCVLEAIRTGDSDPWFAANASRLTAAGIEPGEPCRTPLRGSELFD